MGVGELSGVAGAIVGVGVVITRPDGAILLGLRHYPGTVPSWCLPGGKLDRGESFETAARRETVEETGIGALDDVTPVAVIVMEDADRVCLIGCVEARVGAATEPGLPEPDKFREWRWFQPDAVPESLFGPTAAVLACRRGQPWAGAHAYPICAGS